MFLLPFPVRLCVTVLTDSREAETKGATVLRTVAMRLHVRFLTDMTSLGAEDTAL